MGLTRDFLKGLGLEQSAIDAIMAEHGNGINDLKAQIATLKGNEADFKAQLADYETLKTGKADLDKRIADLTKTNEDLTAEKTKLETASASNLKALKRDYAIKNAILKSGTLDGIAYRAHLDDSKIEYDEEKDALTGYEEQEKAIKEQYGYLFGNGGSQGDDHGGLDGGNDYVSIYDAVNQSVN